MDPAEYDGEGELVEGEYSLNLSLQSMLIQMLQTQSLLWNSVKMAISWQQAIEMDVLQC